MKKLPNTYQDFIYTSRYARWVEDKGRRETWEETIDRYITFMVDEQCAGKIDDKTKELIRNSILNLDVMPSMRALMTSGKAAKRDCASLYNCSYLQIDHPHSFDEMMYLLMCGTGVGFSVERQHIQHLPEISETFYETDSSITIKDSKIGWATAFRELISLLYAGKVPKIDYSKLRPAGSRLKTMGGRSSGPEPLKQLFNFTINLFKTAAGSKLNSLECHDLCCKIAEIVIVGGVRRSALISLSNLSDLRMRDAKTGRWWEENPQRTLANNSVAYTEKADMAMFMSEWKSLYNSRSGERGIFNRIAANKKALESGRKIEGYDLGTNPCMNGTDSVLLKNKNNDKQMIIQQVEKLEIGDEIWSESGWTKVVNFQSSGIKKVYRYTTDFKKGFNYIDLTDNHKVVQNGEKIEVKFAKTIELVPNPLIWEKDYEKKSANIISSEFIGEEEVFDITVDNDTHTFWCNGFNISNCGEIILRPYQTCNLSEVIVRSEDTEETLLEKIEVATIIGTIQSSCTNFRYLRAKWKNNIEEERLLGVSLTGIMDHPLLSDYKNENLPILLDKLRKHAKEVNKKWSKIIGIEESKSITCVKPSGTVSQLTNTASGIHSRHSNYYIRRVRGDVKDPLTQFMANKGVPWEIDKMNPNVAVFSFPIKSPDKCITRNERSAIEQLETWLIYKDHYCDHNPSVTISVKEDEWMEVGAWVYKNFDKICGVSFLPYSDHVYQQAPYEEIDEEQYKEMLDKFPKGIDFEELKEFEKEDTTTSSQTLACTGNSCDIVDIGS